MEELTLKSAQFRRERERSWRELEALLETMGTGGPRNLDEEDLARLPTLYRSAASSLSVARAISLDRNLLDYLTSLVSRAYVAVYGTRRRAGEALARFLTRDFPRLVRRHAGAVVVAIGMLCLGIWTGFSLTLADSERYWSFVPQELAQGRDPASSTDELREKLYSGGEVGRLGAFATMLFTHNARVGLACFALGFAAGAPVVFLVFWNGLLLGAMGALYASRGLGMEFFAWVMPHGVTELLAVCLCAAGGLIVARSLLFPGEVTRMESLKRRGREGALIAMGAVALFLVAGLIEGIFRQLVGAPAVRWVVAGGSFAAWTAYFALAGRGPGGEDG